MKVVDMFGCGLPVCAFKYPALSELVVAKSNGLVFETANELKSQFVNLFKGFPLAQPEEQSQLQGMREVIAKSFQSTRWEDNWNSTLLPLLKNLDKTWADSQMYAENPVYTLNPKVASQPLPLGEEEENEYLEDEVDAEE
jgi:beta-1,4-mannosyltransferase